MRSAAGGAAGIALVVGAALLPVACSRDGLTPPTDGGGAIDLPPRDASMADWADGASACTFPPDDHFTLRVRELDGIGDVQCWDLHGYGESIQVDVTGVVSEVAPATGRFVVDTCPAWVPCKKPRRIEVTLTWPGRDTQLVFPGAFVRLRADVATFEWYCTASLQVESVASIFGRENPDHLGTGALYGAAHRGGGTSYDGEPLTVTRQATGCTRPAPGPSLCSPKETQDLFQLLFAIDQGPLNAVPMGGSDSIAGTPGTRSAYSLRAFNLRSAPWSCPDGFEWLVLPLLFPGG